MFLDIKLNQFSVKEKFSISEKCYLPEREREIETIFSMGNGYVGTRNSLEEPYPQSTPGSFLAGFYEKSIDDEFNILVRMPDWTRIKIFVEDEQLDLRINKTLYHRRYIDLNNGCAVREWQCVDKPGRITSIKIIKFIRFFKYFSCKIFFLFNIINFSYSSETSFTKFHKFNIISLI